MRFLLLCLAILLLGACAHDQGVARIEYRKVYVTVPDKCPDDETYAKVMATKPVPLREQQRPATEAEQRAAERAQLGRYEAPGGYADQSSTVLKSCNARKPLAPP